MTTSPAALSKPQRRLEWFLAGLLAMILGAGWIFTRQTDLSRPLGVPAKRPQLSFLAYSPDNKYLVDTHRIDGAPGRGKLSYWIWSTRSEKLVSTVDAGEDYGASAEPFFVPRANALLVRTRYGFDLYALETGKRLSSLDLINRLPQVWSEGVSTAYQPQISPSVSTEAISPDGRYVFCTVTTVDTQGRAKREGNHFVVPRSDMRALYENLSLWSQEGLIIDLSDDSVRYRFPIPPLRLRESLPFLREFRGDYMFAFAQADTAFLLDLRNNTRTGLTETRTPPQRQYPPDRLSPDGRYAVRSAQFDGGVRENSPSIVEMTSGGRMRWPINQHLEEFATRPSLVQQGDRPQKPARFTADGDYIVVADDHISLWNAKNGTWIRDLTAAPRDTFAPVRNLFSEKAVEPHLPCITNLALSPDSSQAAFVQDDQLRVVSLR